MKIYRGELPPARRLQASRAAFAFTTQCEESGIFPGAEQVHHERNDGKGQQDMDGA